MRALLRVSAVLVVAVKRLLSQPRLALLTVLGLTVAIALTLSIPLYSDAVYGQVFRQAVTGQGAEAAHPPFAFMFRYIGSWFGALKPDQVQATDRYMSDRVPADLGLPLKLFARFYKTETLAMFPADLATGYRDTKRSLAWVTVGTASGFREHITLREGVWPAGPLGQPGEPVPVVLSEELAAKLALHAGENFVLYDERLGPGKRAAEIPVHVAGLWAANDPSEDFWFYAPSALSEVLFVPEDVFAGQVVPRLEAPINLALWYLVFDGSGVHASDAQSLLGRIAGVRQQAFVTLSNLSLDASPVEGLERYEQSAALLTILLYAFSIPIVGLILAFIGLVVALTVGQQRNEIAVLRSRGGTAFQVVGMAALEALILGGLAMALGWPAGEAMARAIGRAQSFLNFNGTVELPVRMTLASLRFGLAMTAVTFVTQVAPTLGAARHTIITYKQERARLSRPPWWQRAWLDLLLLLPAAYGLFLLRQQGSIVLPVGGNLSARDPFQNPLLFLVPSLGVFALTLLVLRVLPLFMSLAVWLLSRTRTVGFLLAARHLARTPGFYTAPLLLLVLTLSLSAFTASLAQTLDDHLYDQSYYQVGADMSVDETGQNTGGLGEPDMNGFSTAATGQAAAGQPQEEAGPRWLFLPVSEYLTVPGVQNAARVGRYPAFATLGGGSRKGNFMGVDRTDFSRVAFWRRDFAPASLGGLMNGLAATPEGVLVPRSFLAQNALSIGDRLQLEVIPFGERRTLKLTVVGAFDLFPSWYPEEGPLFVGNLDYLFEAVGSEYPYSVWLKTDVCDEAGCQAADYERLVRDLGGLGFRVVQWQAASRKVLGEQVRPERQGLFGLLSVGFLAAALLTVLGFFLYALFSFRRRTIELGILRAVGLSSGQMASFLAWELAFLMLTGLAAGTGFGAWISNLFIPYLQVGSGPAAHTPPFLVEVAWPAIFRIYALFGLLFVVALVVLVVLLMRMRIFQAIKLGETV